MRWSSDFCAAATNSGGDGREGISLNTRDAEASCAHASKDGVPARSASRFLQELVRSGY